MRLDLHGLEDDSPSSVGVLMTLVLATGAEKTLISFGWVSGAIWPEVPVSEAVVIAGSRPMGADTSAIFSGS
jgi:hypothetical protein